jgi:hypothetical protein
VSAIEHFGIKTPAVAGRPQNDRRREQKAFKPLHVLLTYTWNLILYSIKKNISLLHSACNIAVKRSKSVSFGRKLKPESNIVKPNENLESIT